MTQPLLEVPTLNNLEILYAIQDISEGMYRALAPMRKDVFEFRKELLADKCSRGFTGDFILAIELCKKTNEFRNLQDEMRRAILDLFLESLVNDIEEDIVDDIDQFDFNAKVSGILVLMFKSSEMMPVTIGKELWKHTGKMESIEETLRTFQ